MKLSDVTHNEIGVWLDGSPRHTILIQNLEIIKMAINTYGWDKYSFKDWTAMYELHCAYIPNAPTEEDAIELSWVLDEAVEWMNDQLPAGYYFTFEFTDFILTHEDYEENK